MGKTVKIYHACNKLVSGKNSSIDIQDTSHLSEFTYAFAKTVFGNFVTLTAKFIESISKIFSNLLPSISSDSLTGQPKINLEIITEEDAIKSLE